MNDQQREIAHYYAQRIMEECQSGDTEVDHGQRDKLLEECLVALGAQEVAEASWHVEGHGFWYA